MTSNTLEIPTGIPPPDVKKTKIGDVRHARSELNPLKSKCGVDLHPQEDTSNPNCLFCQLEDEVVKES